MTIQISRTSYDLIKNNIQSFKSIHPSVRQGLVLGLKTAELIKKDPNLGLGTKIMLFLTNPERTLKRALNKSEKYSELVYPKNFIDFLAQNLKRKQSSYKEKEQLGSFLTKMGVKVK